MSLFRRHRAKPAGPADAGQPVPPASGAAASLTCPAGVVRTCPTCRCPVANPYALSRPRCRTALPPMPDCAACNGCSLKHHPLA